MLFICDILLFNKIYASFYSIAKKELKSLAINLASVRATGAQDSRRILSYITVYDYDITHLQENPQRLG